MYGHKCCSPRHRLEVNSQLHAPAIVPTGRKAADTHYVKGWEVPRRGLNVVQMEMFVHSSSTSSNSVTNYFSYGSTAQFWALAASMKLSMSFQLLDLGQSAGLLGRVISSSQGLCMSAPGYCEDGEVGGMNGFGRGNRSTRTKTCPDATLSTTNHTCRKWARTRATEVKSQRLTVAVMVKLSLCLTN
jgi:hypothetical protein